MYILYLELRILGCRFRLRKEEAPALISHVSEAERLASGGTKTKQGSGINIGETSCRPPILKTQSPATVSSLLSIGCHTVSTALKVWVASHIIIIFRAQSLVNYSVKSLEIQITEKADSSYEYK